MRNCLLFLVSFCACAAYGQVHENFDDGNFTADPVWQGDLAGYTINSANQLQTLAHATSQTIYLSTSSAFTGPAASWEFFIQLNFSPSANNLVRIYLLSDQKDLKGPLNGYYLQVGETGNLDSYDLYKQSGTTVTRLLAGKDQPRKTIAQLVARIRVGRDAEGNWTVESDNTGGRNFELCGSARDKQFSTGSWFGVLTKYTAGNSAKFLFDDFHITPGNNKPLYAAKLNDILINEIMADPSPSAGLPESEYVELLNVSPETIGLEGWSFQDAGTTGLFPADSIKSGEYVILCAKSDTALFRKYGHTIGLSAWPALNNSGEFVSLKSDRGSIINSVGYLDTWYADGTKTGGGWSLERIDPPAACPGSYNWIASRNSKGGTPGQQNSVYTPGVQIPFEIRFAGMVDSVSLRLIFNRPADSASIAATANFLVNNGVGHPIRAVVQGPDFIGATLIFKEPVKRGLSYKITVDGLTDCTGSQLLKTPVERDFFYPKQAVKGNILISEILFNPKSGGSDFVEIYNPTGDVYDLQHISLASLTEKDSLVNIKPLVSSTLLMGPGQYYALTQDPQDISMKYRVRDPASLIKVPSLPPFNDDKGSVVVLRGNERIDQFSYSEKMHFPLIKDKEGVSLERSSFKRNANEKGNFRSAASIIGFATPGFANSQEEDEVVSAEEVFLSSRTFSPDNDGFEDDLIVHYQFKAPGNVANAKVYTDNGILVNHFIKNATLEQSGTFTWNGLNSFDQRQKIGVYILWLEVFDLKGAVRTFKRSCVLAGKLN